MTKLWFRSCATIQYYTGKVSRCSGLQPTRTYTSQQHIRPKILCTDLELFGGLWVCTSGIRICILPVPRCTWLATVWAHRKTTKSKYSQHNLNNTVLRHRDIQPQIKSQASVTERRPVHLQGINSFPHSLTKKHFPDTWDLARPFNCFIQSQCYYKIFS